MSILGDIDAQAVSQRFPELFRENLLKKFMPLFGVVGVSVYFVFVWFFFSMPTVLSSANWGIAGNYLADWISYESRPDISFEPGYVSVAFPRFDPLGSDPHPDWLQTQTELVRKTITITDQPAPGRENAPGAAAGSFLGSGQAGSGTTANTLSAAEAAASGASPQPRGAAGFLGNGGSTGTSSAAGFMGSGGAVGTTDPAKGSVRTETVTKREVVRATVQMGSSTVTISSDHVSVDAYGQNLGFKIDRGVSVTPEQPLPTWALQKRQGDKVIVGLGFAGRIEIENDEVKVRNRFLGWENFLFDTNSPFFGKSLAEVATLVVWGPDIRPGTSNAALAWDNVWNNAEWQHGDVWTKLLQTVVMAFMGTLLASLVAFPLAFFAARNITPNLLLNQGLKRFFDFTRSVDMLIWALFFTRAFGPGPIAGIAAIFFTDTGTFGKLFSEALENVDDKQREGVRAVGAAPILVQRFGIVPQVLPVFVSQTLYFWESNTRSATIIGAVGAGGIGLKLWEAMRTNSDWENVGYMVVLILMVVFVFDAVSNALRSRLIGNQN